MRKFPGIILVEYKVIDQGRTQFDSATDLPARDLLRAAHPLYYIREIDRLLVGETNQDIIDALLDRRHELAQQIKEMGEG